MRYFNINIYKHFTIYNKLFTYLSGTSLKFNCSGLGTSYPLLLVWLSGSSWRFRDLKVSIWWWDFFFLPKGESLKFLHQCVLFLSTLCIPSNVADLKFSCPILYTYISGGSKFKINMAIICTTFHIVKIIFKSIYDKLYLPLSVIPHRPSIASETKSLVQAERWSSEARWRISILGRIFSSLLHTNFKLSRLPLEAWITINALR